MYLDKEKFVNYRCCQWKPEDEKDLGIKTLSVAELKKCVLNMEQHAEMNHLDIAKVPVFVVSDNRKFCISDTSISWGRLGTMFGICTRTDGKYNEELRFDAPDARPEEGEYWESRGISDGLDLSGFVRSQPAGLRLRRMVRLVLEKDETDSWLDWRGHEPNHIQFKFEPTEFDLEKLDSLSRSAGGIITLEILKQCKR